MKAHVLPDGWRTSTIARYIDDPHSRAALAEPFHDVLDLGPVDFAALADSNQNDGVNRYPKWQGNTQLSPLKDDTPAELVRLHRLFATAGRELLGRKLYKTAQIKFIHDQSDIAPGESQRDATPHLDGYLSEGDEELQLVMIGIAFNRLPTQAVQGPKSRKEIDQLGSFFSPTAIYDTSRFSISDLPTNRLLLCPPGLMHFSKVATQPEPSRQFLRWSLRV